MAEMSKEMEDQVGEFYSLQTQLQFVMYQKQQYKVQMEDMNLALEELQKSSGEVYKSAGLIMIKSDAAEAKKELAEKKEVMTVRLGSLAKQEEKIRERLDDLKSKLEGAAKKK